MLHKILVLGKIPSMVISDLFCCCKKERWGDLFVVVTKGWIFFAKLSRFHRIVDSKTKAAELMYVNK